MALPSNGIPKFFWAVVLTFQVVQSVDSDSVEYFKRPSDGEKTICENNHDEIQCPHGTIRIRNAYYGRTDGHTCPSNLMSDKNCKATNSLNIVKKKCENYDKCHLEASNSWFGDPCPNTYKYLRVDYICGIGQPTHSEIICESQSKKISCPDGTIIKVKKASYGRTDKNTCPHVSIKTTDCRAENSLSIVNKRCENKNECHLEASNNWFNDPCEGTYKYLSLEYQCEQGQPTHSEIICESQSKKISCPEGTIIKVKKASYGRTDKNTCPHVNIKTTDCRAENSLSIVNKRCENKNECHLEASNNWFNDPCEGTYKYLSLEYQCEQELIYKSHTETICENNSQKIICPRGASIIIEEAFYGRTDKITCPHQQMHDVQCKAGNAFQIINDRCKHKTECDLQSGNTCFGDPCPGTYKYLQVKYKCV